MGAWRHMRECLQPVLDPTGRRLQYVGRPESASPATGSYKRHLAEQAAVIEAAFNAAAPRKTGVRVLMRRKVQ
jgi:2-oxoglutarate dehydrogenase E1 component